MTKKKIDEGAFVTELRDQSVFFRKPAEEAPAPTASPTVATTVVLTPDERPDDRTTVRTDGRLSRRVPKRYPFEFYQDQLEELKRISLTAQMDGGKGNMSEMVREAVDDWLARHRAQTDERP